MSLKDLVFSVGDKLSICDSRNYNCETFIMRLSRQFHTCTSCRDDIQPKEVYADSLTDTTRLHKECVERIKNVHKLDI